MAGRVPARREVKKKPKATGAKPKLESLLDTPPPEGYASQALAVRVELLGCTAAEKRTGDHYRERPAQLPIQVDISDMH